MKKGPTLKGRKNSLDRVSSFKRKSKGGLRDGGNPLKKRGKDTKHQSQGGRKGARKPKDGPA